VKGKSMNDQQGGVGPDALDGAASWRDPAEVAQWAHELAPGQRVVVYCVHGHEVSQNTARSLRAAGIEADFLQDGFEGWKAAGRALAAKPTAP
jgi:superoxide dismutase, Fe-Mn family